MFILLKAPGGSMSQVVGLLNNSCKPITNTAWVRARLCKLQKRYTRLAASSNKVYQLIAHDRSFSPGTSSSFTTKAGRHDIAEILQNVALSSKKSINKTLLIGVTGTNKSYCLMIQQIQIEVTILCNQYLQVELLFIVGRDSSNLFHQWVLIRVTALYVYVTGTERTCSYSIQIARR